ncbi:YagK/YfjJ domain-containing protein [Halodesulfovibrio marinisediminis]|uniref:YagK/YfjJ C-terminal domain-containing protein n=1 Tax=Halodesulfovibrio marinisediminis DSM 17456 TaxID=1121457 RepID=A0A1N6IFB7_9BACT|nr:inovirus-type Gp2 protein [Halodesulfovibrio marinisediminis]SIO30724.1 Protein of unknown function [Halodesulfovibrio marinisediminis DSM 17456]
MNNAQVVKVEQYNGMPVYNGSKASEGHYVDILNRVYGVLNYQVQKHNKVLVVRFDLHYPAEMNAMQCNSAISQFYDRFTRNLKRNGADPKLVWVWEQCSSHNPHYHCMLTVDGNKHQHPQNLYAKAAEHWSRAIGVACNEVLVDYCNQAGPGYYNLRRNDPDFVEKCNKCFERCSYMAKVRSKEDIPKEVHRHGGSRC